MHVIKARNVNDAYRAGLEHLYLEGFLAESRVGPVLEAPEPVTTRYARPWERVLWDDKRDANPFFHLFESMWMLAGRNDVEPMRRLVDAMKQYSDDHDTFHGAYGHRWMHHFGRDQIEEVIDHLRKDPDSRRCILQMWDAKADLWAVGSDGSPLTPRQGNDRPCNMLIKFETRKVRNSDARELTMQVSNRSNDAILGAHGANSVHMSFLQEYIAIRVGVPMGTYWQISGNYHAYVSQLAKSVHMPNPSISGKPKIYTDADMYSSAIDDVTCMDLIQHYESPDQFRNVLNKWIDNVLDLELDQYITNYAFLDDVAWPLVRRVYLDFWKRGDKQAAMAYVNEMAQRSTNDWVWNARMWVARRLAKKKA